MPKFIKSNFIENRMIKIAPIKKVGTPTNKYKIFFTNFLNGGKSIDELIINNFK